MAGAAHLGIARDKELTVSLRKPLVTVSPRSWPTRRPPRAPNGRRFRR